MPYLTTLTSSVGYTECMLTLSILQDRIPEVIYNKELRMLETRDDSCLTQDVRVISNTECCYRCNLRPAWRETPHFVGTWRTTWTSSPLTDGLVVVLLIIGHCSRQISFHSISMKSMVYERKVNGKEMNRIFNFRFLLWNTKINTKQKPFVHTDVNFRLILTEKHRLRVFENRLLQLFGPT